MSEKSKSSPNEHFNNQFFIDVYKNLDLLPRPYRRNISNISRSKNYSKKFANYIDTKYSRLNNKCGHLKDFPFIQIYKEEDTKLGKKIYKGTVYINNGIHYNQNFDYLKFLNFFKDDGINLNYFKEYNNKMVVDYCFEIEKLVDEFNTIGKDYLQKEYDSKKVVYKYSKESENMWEEDSHDDEITIDRIITDTIWGIEFDEFEKVVNEKNYKNKDKLIKLNKKLYTFVNGKPYWHHLDGKCREQKRFEQFLNFIEKLKLSISECKGKLTYIPLALNATKKSAGHQNMIIIENNNIELYEPNYFNEEYIRESNGDVIIPYGDGIAIEFVKYLAKLLDLNFIEPKDICPLGLQSIEGIYTHKFKDKRDPGGYCVAFSYLWLALRIISNYPPNILHIFLSGIEPNNLTRLIEDFTYTILHYSKALPKKDSATKSKTESKPDSKPKTDSKPKVDDIEKALTQLQIKRKRSSTKRSKSSSDNAPVKKK